MILIENGPGGGPALFDAPGRIIRAETAEEVAPALAALDAARAAGLWAAGFLSYETGYALEPRLAGLMPSRRSLPLLAFGLYGSPLAAGAVLARAGAEAAGARLSPATPDWSAAEHAAAMARVLDYIGAGDIYQTNLTMQMRAAFAGTPLGLYGALRARQPVGHGALVALPDCPVLVSRSPELFFSTNADGVIETRPMKGTAPRASNPAHDAALRLELQQSVKNRAENLMIVDLLRNDISRVCAVGSVRVPELYTVESYVTVHQMVSRVTGRLRPGTQPSALLRALFPCGSVTGAPKIRAMEIIRELEPTPRGAYCGSIGWLGPDGSSAFNVAIRTLTLADDGTASFGVGGGIVADSTPEGEYEEALWKARFAALGRD
ncbi:MAG: aminodeoxychorismate synthase component I [Rhodobacteraceae bacterium]|jgi:para-aminobenzoate synthetase component 1|uniref:aminodeoxychorismate synthase component I n=1 Tax=Albidovulum sp. TaxID=1872424 RepID=UPI001E0BA163|nr:aminodeoxychorismate synthase component I [uncultured Defluviimonas sp.]MCB2124336.1 aminodeoxychorismate synthase component I [Paracoccaceae bacterium]MCC0068893.1 aminodeoxychorismate synthase component I [Paracoccaceae bacterium]